MCGFILIGCQSTREPELAKSNYYTTSEVGNGLHVVTYIEEYGVYADNTYHLYLKHDNSSDSLYIGSHDDNERIFVRFITKEAVSISFFEVATSESPTTSKIYLAHDYVENQK